MVFQVRIMFMGILGQAVACKPVGSLNAYIVQRVLAVDNSGLHIERGSGHRMNTKLCLQSACCKT
jgi:hypothetical protein